MVWLHGKDFAVRSARLRTQDGLEIDLGKPGLPDHGLMGFALDQAVGPGAATLEIAFTGTFGARLGAFRQLVDGRSYVFTDFEPLDARAAFPCFDEPRFKTPWTISLLVPSGDEAFSNMPVAASEPVGRDRKRVRFQTTPPLPSYLVAFAVGPFDVVDVAAPAAVEPPVSMRVPMRVIVPRSKAAWAKTAATIAPELLRIVTDYFATPVPFPKIDMISVPEFSGAMENPGLITVGSHILLNDPERPNIPQERLLALVLAHEFAHLWFGDLVTPADWNELWLNEGFATWLADKALLAWNAQRMPHVEQVVSKLDAMRLDEHLEARAVRQIGDARRDIEAAFDALSYKKGGAILAMFEAWLSAAAFRQGTLAYVAANAGGSGTTSGFVQALSAASSRDVGTAMATFLDQPGIPHVRVELRCTGGRPRVELSQQRYVLLSERERAPGHARPGQALWHIPVCIRYDAGKDSRRACTLLDEQQESIELDTDHCPAWVVPNDDASGYFRYSMPGAELAALARAPLSEREVTELVHDLRALLYAGELDVAEVLPMLEHLAPSSSRHATEAMIALLQEIGDHLVPAPAQARFAAYVQRLYGKRARALGFTSKPGESEETILLRPRLISFVGQYGNAAWIHDTARRHVDTWLRTGRGIERGIIGVTLALAAQNGDQKLYDRIEAELRRAIKQADDERQALLFEALAAFRRSELVTRSLALVEDAAIAGAERHHLVRALLTSMHARERTLRFLEERKEPLKRSFKGPLVLLAPLFGPRLCTDDHLARAQAIVGQIARGHEIIARELADMARTTRACIRFRAAHEQSARAFFR